MTEKQLMASCKRQDRLTKKREDAEYAATVKMLVRALTDKKCRLFPWQLEEVKRLVHEAYGRSRLNGVHGP
jgi:hypothetical protein